MLVVILRQETYKPPPLPKQNKTKKNNALIEKFFCGLFEKVCL